MGPDAPIFPNPFPVQNSPNPPVPNSRQPQRVPRILLRPGGILHRIAHTAGGVRDRAASALCGVADGVGDALRGVAEGVAEAANCGAVSVISYCRRERRLGRKGALPAPPAVSVTPPTALPAVSVTPPRAPGGGGVSTGVWEERREGLVAGRGCVVCGEESLPPTLSMMIEFVWVLVFMGM